MTQVPVVRAVTVQPPADRAFSIFTDRIGEWWPLATHSPAESLFGHIKGDWPHLEKIRDPGDLAAELRRVRTEYDTVRLRAGIGHVTPDGR